MKKTFLLSMMILSSMVATGQTGIQKNIVLDDLRKEVRSESKTIEGSLDDHIRKLNALGYRVDRMPLPSDKVLRQILAIDRRLSDHQGSTILRITSLNDASLIDTVRNFVPTPWKQHDRYDNEILALYRYIHSGQVKGIRESYFMQFDNRTVEHYLAQLYQCLTSEESIVSSMEQLLKDKRQVLDRKRKEEALAEEARREELRQKEAMLLAQKERREREEQEAQRVADSAANEEAAIRSKLPSKDDVRARYRNYTHRTGHVFEMFPIGFAPTGNAGVNDYVTFLGTRYKTRYRETDPSGQVNTLVIDFYESGHVKEVMVYDRNDLIYSAKYADAAPKPYEIRSMTTDHRYYSVFKREYNYDAGKVVGTFQYLDNASGLWVR